MDFNALLPKRDESALLAGMTGTGKSTLARSILTHGDYPNVVIIDPKGTFKFPGAIAETPEEVNALQREPTIIYRPDYDHLNTESYDRVLKWIYLRGNTTVYIDEVFGLSDNGYTYPPALKALLTRGRELKIGVISATQRPAGIPLYTVSESQRFYIWQLQVLNDRKRLASIVGDKALTMMQNHDFLYYNNRGGEECKRMSINLADNRRQETGVR